MAWARGVGVWYNSGIMAERMLTNEERVARANRVTWLSVWVNVALTAGKLVAGVVGHSAAMVAVLGLIKLSASIWKLHGSEKHCCSSAAISPMSAYVHVR